MISDETGAPAALASSSLFTGGLHIAQEVAIKFLRSRLLAHLLFLAAATATFVLYESSVAL